jgi:SAM-dependent methyltransferase
VSSPGYTGTDNLEVMREAVNYNRALLDLVKAHVRASDRLLDFGAGTGTFAIALAAEGYDVECVEPDPAQRAAIEAAGLRAHGDLAAIPAASIDCAYTLNVLEHIEDDEGTLRELFAMVRPGGAVAVYSPAFELLMSDFDRAIGHVRRYRKRELTQKFERAGYEIVEARYVNMPGFFAWLLVSRLLRKRPTDSGLSRLYDRAVVPMTRWVEQRVRPPFGQSVLVIGRVPISRTVGSASA